MRFTALAFVYIAEKGEKQPQTNCGDQKVEPF